MVTTICKEQSMERGEVRFSRRDVRERAAWGDTQLKIHLARLAELELVVVHKGGRGQSFVYELAWDGAGRDGARFLTGLIDAAGLDCDDNRSAQNDIRSGSGRPVVGARSGAGHNDVSPINGQVTAHVGSNSSSESEKHTSAGESSFVVIDEAVAG
jgi:hypothetical protein